MEIVTRLGAIFSNDRYNYYDTVKEILDIIRLEALCNMEILTWHARSRKNITLKQLETLTGISKSTLNNIENGKVDPKIKQLEAIAKALDMKIIDLFESEYK